MARRMEMRKVLVIQHAPSEGPGTISAELKKAGLGADYIRAYAGDKMPPNAKGYLALIVLGGPMGVYEEDIYPFIKDELRLIRSALKNDMPIMGVCLGSQMLARAAGADVYRGKIKEIGWYKVSLTGDGAKDRLFIGMPGEFTVFQWHGDTFDVPEKASLLSSSKLFKNQVIRVGRRAYGLQFHLEVTPEMIRDWTEVNSRELVKASVDPKKIIKETPLHIYELNKMGSAVISRFLRLLDAPCPGCNRGAQNLPRR